MHDDDWSMYPSRWTDWSGRLYSLEELEEDDFPCGGVVDELRPPTPEDAKIFAVDVLEHVRDWVYESETLSCDDGNAELPVILGSALDRLQTALDDYVKAHVDLSTAAWQPTGRSATRTDAGWIFTPPLPIGDQHD